MKHVTRFCRLSLVTGMLALVGCQPVRPEAPPPAPQEVTVLAGAGQDVVSINAFFPASVRIRAGDTLTWKINSDEPHSVLFLSGQPMPPDPVPVPGGGADEMMLNPKLAFPSRAPDAPVEKYSGSEYRVSGDLSNGKVVPPNESYSLLFEKPGTYKYICGIHPGTMFGEVIVEAVTVDDLPTQTEIDAQAQAEVAPLLAMAEETRVAATTPDLVRQEPGPNGSSIWYVPAGLMGLDPRIEVYDFFPKNLTIQSGDTVIWTSTFVHQVIFHPGEPAPEFVLPREQESEELPLLVINPVALFPVKPMGEFDGTTLFSSGLIGLPAGAFPGGTTFAMTFGEPGSYEYVCALHRALGMTGAVTVVAR